MSASPANISVMAAPFIDPSVGRTTLTLPEGLSVAEIVDQTFPGLTNKDHLRVVLVSPSGTAVILRKHWHCVRPSSGVHVVIRTVPGKDALKLVLLAVVTIAAGYIAPFLTASFLPTAAFSTSLTTTLISAGITAIGSLIVNALIPLPTAGGQVAGERRNVYSVSNFRNTARRDDPIPSILGLHRYAPPLAAGNYTEIVGDDQYIRALFCFGDGALKLSDFKIGDTSLSEYNNVDIEVREGRVGDLPLSLYPRQVLEDAISVELVRPLPRDAAGKVTSGASIETPVRRFTALDTAEVSVFVSLPSGLFSVANSGAINNRTVSVRIRQRVEGASSWTDVQTLEITSSKREAFFRQYSWALPTRGRWEIEVTRMSDESTSTQVSDRTILAAIQSIRPEYPVNMNKPLTLVAMRIKATSQLNGSLDNFNAVVQRYGQVYDAVTQTWSEGLTRNPASAYITALTGGATPFPVLQDEIDYDLLAEWFEFCKANNLKYDRVHDQAEPLQDMLFSICAAGRATPRHDGIKWGVVIDRPETLVVDHINSRNSSDFQWSRNYFRPPDAFRVTFLDETNDYNQAERIVPWPGHTGDIVLTESLPLLGKTDPNEVWIEARRRMFELLHRPDTFTAIQDGSVRVVTRGDQVMGSFDVLDRTQVSARVKAVREELVELDDSVVIEAGVDYGLRFRVFVDAQDTIGFSQVRKITASVGETRLLRVTGSGDMPAPGMIVHFGTLSNDSVALKVRGIEAGQNFSSVLNLVAAAPIIDELTDAEVPPAWNGRVGAAVSVNVSTPTQPKFTSVLHGASGTGQADRIEVLLSPGTGSAAILKSYRIEHKPAIDTVWTSATVPVADGGAPITAYVAGDDVDIRAYAISVDDIESIPTPTISLVIGSSDAVIPTALNAPDITVTGSLGSAQITLTTTADASTSQIQIYRAPAGQALNRSLHATGAPINSTPSTTIDYYDGDGTRINLLLNGEFADASNWTLDPSWTLAAGKASHASGVADSLKQLAGLVSGKFYRLAFTVLDRTAGALAPRLTGGSDVSGLSVNANGTSYDRIQAVTGNDTLDFLTDASFDGSIDDVILYQETATSVAQGDYDYYLEPQNVDNVPGPISGPFNVKIV
jgi:hypothetical protein